MRRAGYQARVLGWLLAGGLVLPAAAPGAGFSIFEQGAKGMGLAGAFTAQADDPSAMFHNAGGLAFQNRRAFMVGFTYIGSESSSFRGANPFPGSAARANLEPLGEYPVHAYFVQPINDRLTFGMGLYTPFGLTTEWKNPSQFAGRYLSTKAALRTFDFNPTLAVKLGESFGVGFGAIARFSDVELQRFVPQVFPFTGRVVDVARVHLESDLDRGYGWNVGLLHKVNNSFSWGLAYRSEVDIEYAGDARFTQIPTGSPQFDAAVAQLLPFAGAVPVETAVDFPDQASFGVALALNASMVLELDANWIGWSSFEEIRLTFPRQPALSSVVREEWEDANHYRVGLRWRVSPTAEWRFGYVYDETPQPEQAVGPLLPDADRNGYTIGYGHAGAKMNLDLAFMYLPFDEREVTVSRDNFFGTYESTAYLFAATLSF